MSTTACQAAGYAGQGVARGVVWDRAVLRGWASGMREQQRGPEGVSGHDPPLPKTSHHNGVCSELPGPAHQVLLPGPAAPDLLEASSFLLFLISAQIPLPKSDLPNHKTAPTPPLLSALESQVIEERASPPSWCVCRTAGRRGLQSSQVEAAGSHSHA